LPSLFQVGGYKVFFWSNENDEQFMYMLEKESLTLMGRRYG